MKRPNDETSAANPISSESPSVGWCAGITRVCSDFHTAHERVQPKDQLSVRGKEDERTKRQQHRAGKYRYICMKYIYMYTYIFNYFYRNVASAKKKWATLVDSRPNATKAHCCDREQRRPGHRGPWRYCRRATRDPLRQK